MRMTHICGWPRLLARLLLLATAVLAFSANRALPATLADAQKKIPVILDTDIGDDIDDTWALGLLLKSPEFDIKLVVGDQGKNLYRARLIAKFLERAGRTDIPIGIGLDANAHGDGGQADWVNDFNLNAYPGRVYPDGVRAMINVIMQSKEPVTLIGIGPLPNVSEALKQEPRIAAKARFVGMHGSVRVGYDGGKQVSAEYNVQADAKACQRVFLASWPMTITPLDTCGIVHLQGGKYRQVLESSDPIARAIIENYRIWCAHRTDGGQKMYETRSSTLFDTVAIYLAFEDRHVTLEALGIRVPDDGFTRIDSNARSVRVATSWKDMNGFEDFLVKRLTSK